MRASDFLARVATLAPADRDAAIEELLGIAGEPPSSASPGDDLIGYHASGLAPIVRMLIDVPVVADDVVIDLGSGLGKVVILARLLTGATARGIEIQPALVHRANVAAARLGVDVHFAQGDVRDADLDDGTVFFLYLPFTGPVLADVMRRLHGIASRRAIVVCALGMGLDREHPWLVRRAVDSFWLTIYESVVPNVPSRRTGERSPSLNHLADAIALEHTART
jgi:hypothetical protein